MNAVMPAEEAKTRTDTGYVCPHCGKTEHTPNAVTLAAMRETEALLKGEIPHEHYNSVDEVIKDLRGWADA
jgi:hypothetical protein